MIKRILEFNRTEKNGILVLIFMIILVMGINLFLPAIISNTSEPIEHEDEYQQFLSLIQEKANTVDSSAYNHEALLFAKEKIHRTYFNFDPNTSTKDDLKKLGFNDFQINNLQKYIHAGGYIAQKSDLLKIYGINKSLYKNIEPYIAIPEPQTDKIQETDHADKETFTNIIPIHINRATTNELQQVYGVGPKRSLTILKYRDLLGGYHHPEQLKEVYGLPDSTIHELTKILIFDTVSLQRISLNQSEFKDLVRHPYISEFHTKSILKYRDMKERINSTQELYTNRVLDSITWSKVRFYLKP
ncbi:MAG: hypothetical protein GVY19_10485 [Bacteroidetes bacterium]|jgi:competence ComEA-like helix-hairpin-helix protein|nr:hypothetical protein [Bacteroidota bacterium]